jgi:uncharacterized Zn finger protein
MAQQWWSRRFVDMLESYGLGARMQRGRRYARMGQVLSVEVEPGLLAAQVQGSRATPYLTTIRLAEVTSAQWTAIETELAARVGLVASLLAGEVPEALADAFEGAGVPLFPLRWDHIRATCNCPDSASPCKHLAAVLYVFADQLDTDPWLLLKWRGRTRTEIVDLLRSTEVSAGDRVAPWWPFAAGPLPESALVAPPSVSALPVEGSDSALDRLAAIDIEVLGSPLVDLLRTAYDALSESGD